MRLIFLLQNQIGKKKNCACAYLDKPETYIGAVPTLRNTIFDQKHPSPLSVTFRKNTRRPPALPLVLRNKIEEITQLKNTNSEFFYKPM